MKKTNSKIIYIITLIVVITIIVCLVMYIKYDNKKQEEKLTNEINLMYNSKQIDTTAKTKGEYKSVELSVKSYYAKYLNTKSSLLEIYSKNPLSTALNETNISEDGKEFNNTKAKINNIKDIENETIKKYEEIISEEYINYESEKENLSSKYNSMYVSLIYNNLKIKEDFQNLKQTIKEYNIWLDNIDAVLNFLSSNKNKWSIKDNNIIFKSNDLVNEYNDLINKVNSNKETLSRRLESIH